MIRWEPLPAGPSTGAPTGRPAPAEPSAGLRPFAEVVRPTSVARRSRTLRPVGADDVPTGVRVFAELAAFFAVVIGLIWGVQSFVAKPFFIPSESMMPQLAVDDRVLVSKIAYRLHEPNRGDVVVFDEPGAGATTAVPQPQRSPLGEAFYTLRQWLMLAPPDGSAYIKRVIGLPGDSVQIRDGDVFVNGQRLVEPYLPPGVDTQATGVFGKEPVVVPDGHLWVMGDNRGGSRDSRFFGTIPQETVVGRAFVIFWPFQRAAFL